MPRQSFLHLPRSRNGFDCPQPIVHIPLSNLRGTYPVRFIFDTGSAITLVPISVARSRGISFEATPADTGDCPNTLTGRLQGHFGEIRTTFLDRELILPCFCYTPRPNTERVQTVAGPPGRRTTQRQIATTDDYFTEVQGEGEAPGGPCVLGRLGFTNRFHILVDSVQTTISTDSFRMPRRSRFGWW